MEQNPGFRKMLRSKLFMVPTLLIVNNSLYIAILVVILLLLDAPPRLQLVTIWSCCRRWCPFRLWHTSGAWSGGR